MNGPISSSDDTEQGMIGGLHRLVGEKVENVEVETPGWDLVLQLTGRFILHIFCDHVPGDPSFDGNWQVSLEEKRRFAGSWRGGLGSTNGSPQVIRDQCLPSLSPPHSTTLPGSKPSTGRPAISVSPAPTTLPANVT